MLDINTTYIWEGSLPLQFLCGTYQCFLRSGQSQWLTFSGTRSHPQTNALEARSREHQQLQQGKLLHLCSLAILLILLILTTRKVNLEKKKSLFIFFSPWEKKKSEAKLLFLQPYVAKQAIWWLAMPSYLQEGTWIFLLCILALMNHIEGLRD